MSEDKKWRADDVKRAIAHRHASDMFFTEVKDGPTQIVNHHSRIDALAIKLSLDELRDHRLRSEGRQIGLPAGRKVARLPSHVQPALLRRRPWRLRSFGGSMPTNTGTPTRSERASWTPWSWTFWPTSATPAV